MPSNVRSRVGKLEKKLAEGQAVVQTVKVYVGFSPEQWGLDDPASLWELPPEKRQPAGCGYVAFADEAEYDAAEA